MLRHKRSTLTATAVILAAAFGLAACDDEDPVAPPQPDIVEIASSSANFETLVAAIEAAGLVGTLSGEGPFTVFAPTDAAFEALPDGTLESLLQPENQGQLVDILTFHVVPGELLASDVLASTSLSTVLGQDLTVTTEGGVARVGNATIVQTDIGASNGVIHVIDAVLLP